jgi:hypothetical protein
MTADIPHNAGFATDPDPAVALRESKLPHRLFQLPPDLSDRPIMVHPRHCKPRGRLQRQFLARIGDLDEDVSKARSGQGFEDRPDCR